MNTITKTAPGMQVVWRKLVAGDTLQCGDMFSRHDPNTPERQSEPGYNLQMQAVDPADFGVPLAPSGGGYDEGTLWRPVGIIKTEILMVETPARA